MKNIYVKMTQRWLECEKVKGVSETILGSLVTHFEKIKEIPDNFKEINTNQALECITFYDAEGIEKVYTSYTDDNDDIKHNVKASKYFGRDSNDEYFYYEFTLDEYSKFVYLFNKEKRLFQWHY